MLQTKRRWASWKSECRRAWRPSWNALARIRQGENSHFSRRARQGFHYGLVKADAHRPDASLRAHGAGIRRALTDFLPFWLIISQKGRLICYLGIVSFSQNVPRYLIFHYLQPGNVGWRTWPLSFGTCQKRAGGKKGSERDLNSGGKTRVEKGASFTDLARGAISSDGT